MSSGKVSHERVLKNAIALLVAVIPRDAAHEEEIANSISELEDLLCWITSEGRKWRTP